MTVLSCVLTDATLISAPTSSINSTLRLLVSNALKNPPPDSLVLVNVKPAQMGAAIRNLLNRLAPKSVTNKWTLDTKLMIVRTR